MHAAGARIREGSEGCAPHSHPMGVAGEEPADERVLTVRGANTNSIGSSKFCSEPAPDEDESCSSAKPRDARSLRGAADLLRVLFGSGRFARFGRLGIV